MKYGLIGAMCIGAMACKDNTTFTGSMASGTEPAEISVTVKGVNAGKAYLVGTYGGQNYHLDSVTISAEGKMVFQRPTSYPAGLLFVLMPDGSFLQMLADKDQQFDLSAQLGDFINTMQIEGSEDNTLYYQSLRGEADIQQQYQEVSQQLQSLEKNSPTYQQLKEKQTQLVSQRINFVKSLCDQHPNSFFAKFKLAGQNPDVYAGEASARDKIYMFRGRMWDNVDFTDERLLNTPVVHNKLKQYITELTPQHPDSINKVADLLMNKVLDKPAYYKFFANWIVLNYEPSKTTLMDPEAVFVHMVQKYFSYDRDLGADSVQIHGLQLRAHEMAGSLVGKKAPDVKASDPSGAIRSILEIKSPYIVVFIYNPTCEHCIEETPQLVNFYRQWKNEGVEIFGIAINTQMDEWKQFISRNGITWANVFDATNQAIYAKYFVDNTPEIYVLDPDRTIIAKNLKVKQIEEVIKMDKAKPR